MEVKNDWISELQLKKKRVYSQQNQDGVIQYIFENIGTTNKFCVEFGFNSHELTGGSGSNVARLILEDEWDCLLLDDNYENKLINLYKELLTFENIGDIFKKYSVPIEPDYISIDVDSIDLWLMKSLLLKGYKPRLISVEYNSNFPLEYSYTSRPDTRWNDDMVFGASLLALYMVAKEFDYSLITVVTGADLFFVRNDLLIGFIPPITQFQSSTGIPCHKEISEERLKYLVEYPSMNSISDDIIKKSLQIFRIKNKNGGVKNAVDNC